MNLSNLMDEMMRIGYEENEAQARVCQDIILKALSLSSLSLSSLSRNVCNY